MKINQDTLFIMLSGFAKSCIETQNKGNILNIANAVGRYFDKHIDLKQYKRSDKLAIANYINKKVDPKLEALQNEHDGKTSPQILLVLGLDMLINEYGHTTTRAMFGHFKKDIMSLVDKIYMEEQFKPYIKSHSKFIVNI